MRHSISHTMSRGKILHTHPKKCRVEELERLVYCKECWYDYTSFCKHCDLDGCCPEHGIDLKYSDLNQDWVCPTCGQTFSEIWDKHKRRFEAVAVVEEIK